MTVSDSGLVETPSESRQLSISSPLFLSQRFLNLSDFLLFD